MKIILRKSLRALLKWLCILAINKHDLKIIAVGGWYGTDITREAIYSILKKSNKKVRRSIVSPQVDWEIPLTILGVRSVPTNPIGWIYLLCTTSIRLVILKPNPSILILEVSSQDAGIMKYWMSFLESQTVIMLNSHLGTLNLELLLVESLVKDGCLILNNDNIRTKSLAQGRRDGVIYFGEAKKAGPDFSYALNPDGKVDAVKMAHNGEFYTLKKTLPEFVYPFLAAATSLCEQYDVSFADACLALDYFELPSEKVRKILHKFVTE
jgi:UDP-N-acetylmuramyl pentapeptide synthase